MSETTTATPTTTPPTPPEPTPEQLADKALHEASSEAWAAMVKDGFVNKNIGVKVAGIKGLGVFALRDIPVDTDIEFCHAIVLGHRAKYINDPELRRYCYWASNCKCNECRNHGNQALIALGFGCIYNSAETKELRNADFRVIAKMSFIVFRSVKPIKEGEEILTWWGQGYFDSWCKPREARGGGKEGRKAQDKAFEEGTELVIPAIKV